MVTADDGAELAQVDIAAGDDAHHLADPGLARQRGGHWGRAGALGDHPVALGQQLEGSPWGSETPIRSRGGAVVLVDQPAEEVPAVDITRTDCHQA